jgi:transcription antitermination factor NusG
MGSCVMDKGEELCPFQVDAGEWIVLHVMPRQEKALADDLSVIRVPHFLPLVKTVRYYGRRKVAVDQPLFPGYLFLRGRKEDAFFADRIKRVVNIIPVHDQERLHWELKNLNMALEGQAPMNPFPFLKNGVRVEVRSGPFRGLQGEIEGRTKCDRLLLQVKILGRAVSLELEGALLDVI